MSLSMCKALATEYDYELLNENDGFTSSIIFSIIQDKDGFIWFGTGYNGILRYDGKSVVTYKHNPSDEFSLPNDNSGNLTLDRHDNLWIGSWGGGAIKLEKQTNVFKQFTYSVDDITTISATKVQRIFEDDEGDLWFGTFNGGLNKFNQSTQDFVRFPMQTSEINGMSDERIWDIEQTQHGKLWIASEFGLNLFDKKERYFTHLFPQPDALLSEVNKIRAIQKGAGDILYLGTQDGVVSFDTVQKTFTPIVSAEFTNIGPIYSMIKTDFDEYWVTSDHGVFLFSDENQSLEKVPFTFDDRCSQTLFQDKQGTIWLSCEGVGLYKITRTDVFKSFDDQRVKTVFALEIANDNSVLIGTSQFGLHKWIPETNEFFKLSNNEDTASQPEIRYITQTKKGDIWFANSQSLFKLDENGNHNEIFPPKELWGDFASIKDIQSDHQDNIWVATRNRIFIINSLNDSLFQIDLFKNETDAETNYSLELYNSPNNTMWLSAANTLYRWDENTEKFILISLPKDDSEYAELYDYIYEIFRDSKNRLWITNKTGLFLVNEESGTRQLYSSYFLERDNRGIRFISEDINGYLWLVTPIGVSRLNPQNGDFQHFDKRDGLPGSRYFLNPTARTSDGTIYLSSREGISYFNPTAIRNRDLDEKTLLTKFEVLGASNNYNISEIKQAGVQLDYDQTNVKFEFATLDLLNARQIQYSYKLDGFDEGWIENGNNNTATYTNLSGGNYVFKVRARIKDDLWYNNELKVSVDIATPIWERWWMFLVYVCVVLLAVLNYLRGQKRAVVELERQVAEKTADIAQESKKLAIANRIKTQFLANMSHEIRTPLTTVIGQAEAIICREIEPDDIHKEVEIIHDSSLYLLALLNDILDLTKIEENKFELDYAPQNLHTLLTNINTMFSMQAKVKGLSFSMIESLPTPFIINIDGLRLKQILINLLSNALKFTLKGYVTLEISIQDKQLVFIVEDSGIGISQEQIEQIFGSFTQGDSSIRRRFGGSGLGLYLSNQLAVLMKGQITVKSEFNKGSEFTFKIPLPAISTGGDVPQANFDFDSLSSRPLFNGKILLAEDHADNRRLITRLLSKLGLTVFTAADGYEAIKQYTEHQPELILMDIQMPKMDGLLAYKTLREQGCDKPIIALTANAMTNEVEEYFALGFDGYIQKPIDRQLLISTIATFFDGKNDDYMDRANSVLGNVDMSDLVSEFKVSLIQELENFTSESNKQDVNALKALAHRLSGASILFGFSELSQKATTLETKIKQGKYSFTEIQPDIEDLISEIQRILA